MGDTWAAIRADGARARRTAEAGRFRRALARAGWSLARASRALGVDVETFGRYLARQHPTLCEERRRMAKLRR
jgi:transcriptional regulator with GAF, ATPase, and Fis domain